MTIISTKFKLAFDYNLLFKDAFDGCMANETCSKVVPSLINIANSMQEDFVDTTGLGRAEKNDQLGDWMNRVLYDQGYTELYRMIFLIYQQKIQSNQVTLDGKMQGIRQLQLQISSQANAVAQNENTVKLLAAYEKNKLLQAEASTNLTKYQEINAPILLGITQNITLLDNNYRGASTCVEQWKTNTIDFQGF